jgi:hypothetical protein
LVSDGWETQGFKAFELEKNSATALLGKKGCKQYWGLIWAAIKQGLEGQAGSSWGEGLELADLPRWRLQNMPIRLNILPLDLGPIIKPLHILKPE